MTKSARRGQSRRLIHDVKYKDPCAASIARAAVSARDDLARDYPKLSAKIPAGHIFVLLLGTFSFAAALGALGATWLEPVWLMACAFFSAIGLLRLAACASSLPARPSLPMEGDIEAAPVWTILIALYREADSVASLLEAIAKLEWARDRLDIIFACERDDLATIQALNQCQHLHGFRIVRVPTGGPRTKPNALQTALPYARGRFVTVYDAEDRPDPGQLRAAFHAFVDGPEKLAVVQAPLVAWNDGESWIAQQFALDYAIWFRIVLPALSRHTGLLPLGGTSNHFRTQIVRDVGGWDPFNVTEDADLGVRLARNGYCAGLISPPTYEEAPPRISAWVKQRGRWIQGHIQTFSLHLREPRKLGHQIGQRGLVSFFLGLGLGPLSAVLMVPCTMGWLLSVQSGMTTFAWAAMCVGLSAHMITACVAAWRDGRWRLMGAVATLPLYQGLQFIAACRALWRVVFTPSFWDKTDHGRAARTKGSATQI